MAINPRKVAGQTKIIVNGETFDCEPKSTLELGGTKRDAVQADHKAGFFSETTVESKLSVSVLLTPGVSADVMRRWDDVTAQMQTDTGQTYVINHGYVADIPTISDGKVSLVIQGPPAEEIL